jgi:hypothetical protein
MRWIVSFAILSFAAICAETYYGYEPSSLIGLGLSVLLSLAFFGVLIYLCLIWPVQEIIQELHDGWPLIDSLIRHCVALGFFGFVLLPFAIYWVKGSPTVPDFFWGFCICCLIKFGSLLNRRQYRQNAGIINDFLACIHDPQKKFSNNYYLPRKPKPKGRDHRWPFGEEKGPWQK